MLKDTLEQMAAALRSAEFALVSSGYDMTSNDATGLNISIREEIDLALRAYRCAMLDSDLPAAPQCCADCGLLGETTGHMTCQYPQDR